MQRARAWYLAPLWALLGTSCQDQAGKCSSNTNSLCLQFELADHSAAADDIKLTVSASGQNHTFDFPNIAAQLAARPYVVEVAFDTSVPTALDLDAVANVTSSTTQVQSAVATAKLTMISPAAAARPTRVVLQAAAGSDLGMSPVDMEGANPTDSGAPVDLTPVAWKTVYTSTGTPLNALFGIGGTTKIYAAGNNGRVVSGDGNTFAATAAAAGTGTLSGIWVASAMSVFACDKQGTTQRTIDGGSTWISATAGYALAAIYGRSATDVLAVGNNIMNALRWDGSNWIQSAHNQGTGLTAVFASASYYYALGGSGIGARAPTPQTMPWTSLSVKSTAAPWVLAGLGTTDSFTIAVSNSGNGVVQYLMGTATTWNSMTSPGINTLNAVWVPEMMKPIVGGDSGTVYQYIGGTWSSLGSLPSGYKVTGLWGDGSGTLWASASNGTDGAIFKR